MTTRNKLVVGAIALVMLYSFKPGGCSLVTPSGSSPSVQSEVHWQSAGDSFSSGEGIFGNAGDCAQSDLAYGPVAARALDAGSWDFASVTFTACTGRRVEEFFNIVPGSTAEAQGKSSLWDWGLEQDGPSRVDVLTMSIGGNDIGFPDVIVGCLVLLPEGVTTWTTLLGPEARIEFSTGCDDSTSELEDRIIWLNDPARSECTGWRTLGTAGYDCPLRLQGRQGSISDLYSDLVLNQLTPRGHLYVVTYPRLFAPSSEWPKWSLFCNLVSRSDADMLGEAADKLNAMQISAVAAANERLGSERIHVVDRLSLFRDGSHELCGTGPDWLNGVTLRRGPGLTLRWQGSFHPNAQGHHATATRLVSEVTSTFR